MGKKGQGASEYLMILGAVLIVALTAATLIGYFGGFSGDISAQESRAYWVGYAQPFAIYDAVYNGNGGRCKLGDIGPYPPQIELSIKNNDKYPLNLTSIDFDAAEGTVCSPPGAISSPPYRFAPNEQKVVAARAIYGKLCAGKKSEAIDITIGYDSPYLSGKKQKGTTKLIVVCT